MAKIVIKTNPDNENPKYGVVQPKKISKSHQNRGMHLENRVVRKCEEYIRDGLAYIYKIPTDWNVVRGKNFREIISAFPVQKSIVDFLGSVDGYAVAIETKSCNSKTSFPLSNIGDHQLDFFKLWRGKSLGYYIIDFPVLKETYMVDSKLLSDTIDTLDRKSIPINWFKDNAFKLDKYDFLPYIKQDISAKH